MGNTLSVVLVEQGAEVTAMGWSVIYTITFIILVIVMPRLSYAAGVFYMVFHSFVFWIFFRGIS
jgi:hypothetical protein